MTAIFIRKNCVFNRIFTLLLFSMVAAGITLRAVGDVRVNLVGGSTVIIGVHFDQFVGLPSATAIANYTIYGKGSTAATGINVTNAVLQADGQTVALYLDTFPGEFFAVGISNVAGSFGTNIVTTATGFTGNFNTISIGTATDPSPAGAVIPASADTFTLNASGSDISAFNNSGTNDHCQFLFSPSVGDFEAAVQVTQLDNTYTNAKASLMARENFTAGSRSVEIHLTPLVSGTNQVVFTYRLFTNTTAETLNVFQPNSLLWLRMTRTNNNFTVYYGTNGFDWTAFGSIAQAWNTTLVGPAATSGSNGFTTTAGFSSFGINTARPGDGIVPKLNFSIYQKTNFVAMWTRTPRDFSVQVSTNFITGSTLTESNYTTWAFLMLPIYDSALTGTNDEMPTLGRYMTIPMDLFPGAPMYVRLAQVARVIPDPLGVTPGVIFSQASGSMKGAPAGLSTICGAPVVSATAVAQTNVPIICPCTPAGKYSYQFTTLPSGSSYQTVLTVRNFPIIGVSNCDTAFSAGSGKSKVTLTPAIPNTGYTFVAAANSTPPVCNPILVQVNVITNF